MAEQFPGSDELTKAISAQCQQHLALLFNEAVRPRESFLMNRTIQGDSTILVPELFWVLVVLKGPFRLLQGFPELGSPEAIRCISQWKAHSFTTALANVVSSLGKNASLTHHAGCRKKKSHCHRPALITCHRYKFSLPCRFTQMESPRKPGKQTGRRRRAGAVGGGSAHGSGHVGR